MPIVDPSVVLRLGSHAEKDYFLNTIELWDGLMVGANLLEAAPGATSSMVLKFSGKKHKIPYYIDPMTYAFGTYIEHGSNEPRTDLDWIKSEQKNKETQRLDRRYKRSYRALAEIIGGPLLNAIENDEGISPDSVVNLNEIDQLCDAVIQYQRTRIRNEFESDTEYGAEAGQIPTPAAVFAPYFYIDPVNPDTGLALFAACANASASLKVDVPVHVVLCTDASTLDSEVFLAKAAESIKESGVDGVWLWFSLYYEEAASTARLLAFRKFIEELSESVQVFNMHGGLFSLALSRYGLSGTSHGVGYGEQKDVIPVIGQSTPTVRYYLPELGRRLSVPQIERALLGVGVKNADQFFELVCDCAICRGIIGEELSNFTSFGDLHYSTAESKRKAQTPAAAKRCRFHFLLNRARERDRMRGADVRTIAESFQDAYLKWEKQPTLHADAQHLLRWKNVFEV